MKGEHGQVEEALKYLNEAYSMRKRIFGANSQKVADTLTVMSKVYLDIGDKKTAKKLAGQALLIRRSASSGTVGVAFYSALMTILLMAVVYAFTSKNGWLTRFALAKLQSILRDENVSAAKEEKVLQQLLVLRQYAKQKELSSIHADKKHELADNLNAAGCLLSLT